MTPIICPACRAQFAVARAEPGKAVACPQCGQWLSFSDPPPTAAAPGLPARRVCYRHHTRDQDGEVIFFFTDPLIQAGEALLQSSPVNSLKRLSSAVIDGVGHGSLARYRLTTENTQYEVQMPLDKAHHLAVEIGQAPPA